ncbi:MAG: ATP-dependent DNA ligase, partial [Pseudomonadota bacterium]|nr:ATP-dependent DNA ligase [Pseudomonadota bacterium]
PWGSRIDRLDAPDRIIFDLDPGEGVAWSKVIAAAQEVRERLKSHKLRSFVKVSGGKGLHVVAPIERGPDWDRVKDYSRQIAEAMAADAPNFYLARMTKRMRTGKVFVDYLRNGRGATAVAAYSTRARAGAPVSVPLAWEELTEAIGPSHFSVENLVRRLDFLKADPWAGFERLRQRLPGKEP